MIRVCTGLMDHAYKEYLSMAGPRPKNAAHGFGRYADSISQ